MFPNISLPMLMSARIYEFPNRKTVYSNKNDKVFLDYHNEWNASNYTDKKPIYLEFTSSNGSFFDKTALLSFKNNESSYDEFWWWMNEAWDQFGEPNPNLPLYWLAYSKFAIDLNYLPSNFQPWALAILEWFDLERYNKAYNLPKEEYDAIKHDLSIVINGLRNYSPEKFAPPVDENHWGYHDF